MNEQQRIPTMNEDRRAGQYWATARPGQAGAIVELARLMLHVAACANRAFIIAHNRSHAIALIYFIRSHLY